MANPSPVPQPRVRPATIMAIASGKGGVGKTWLSVTLACAWGRAGRRALVVDCDLGLANIDVQLGVRPVHDLHAALRGWTDFDAAITPVLGGAGRGFDLVAGHSGSGALQTFKPSDADAISDAVRKLAPRYDTIVLDLAAGIDPGVIRFAAKADSVVIVTTEEPTALTDAYAFAKLLKREGVTAPPHVVVNMAENRIKGRRVFEQLAAACEQYLQYRPRLAGIVCRDSRVPDAIRAQTPLPVRHPQSLAYDDVVRVAETLSSGAR
ncbi:MAG: AAA family ATPase [Hyphomonadaceae bacterium]|nr:AAA family ATPase [Hyphomonadaceae bacterium]